MNKQIKALLGLAALIIIFVCVYFAYDLLLTTTDILPENIYEAAEAVELAPDFTVTDANGNQVQLSDFRGKPVVLNFWTSWCPSCVAEMPYFEQLYTEMGTELKVFKVNLLDGQRETLERVHNLMEERALSFPLFFDTTGEASAAYGVHSIPVTFFIDSQGAVAGMARGALNENTLQQGLELITQ